LKRVEVLREELLNMDLMPGVIINWMIAIMETVTVYTEWAIQTKFDVTGKIQF
jgi:hypothetical protein